MLFFLHVTFWQLSFTHRSENMSLIIQKVKSNPLIIALMFAPLLIGGIYMNLLFAILYFVIKPISHDLYKILHRPMIWTSASSELKFTIEILRFNTKNFPRIDISNWSLGKFKNHFLHKRKKVLWNSKFIQFHHGKSFNWNWLFAVAKFCW